MLVLMAIMIVWLGVLRPVTRGLADAKTAHIAAVDRAAGVKAGLALLRHAAPPPPRIDGPLDQLIASSAAEAGFTLDGNTAAGRSEEHTSELQSLMRNSYAVLCFNKTKPQQHLLHKK